MKTKLILLAMVLIFGAGSYPGFIVGQKIQRKTDESEAIKNDVGFYDAKNASFKWGNYEAEHMAQLNLEEVLGEPTHKPHVQHP